MEPKILRFIFPEFQDITWLTVPFFAVFQRELRALNKKLVYNPVVK